jgi:prepilin-type N-terminal cleavage/methylation domain-containing protein
MIQEFHMLPPAKQAFSLVELSIVLVILGLLIGGILSGQALIRASELRSVTTQSQTLQTAMMTFRDKYFALPGDMTNATQFWGKDNTNCTADTGTASTPGTCNGNGDGVFALFAESYRTWQHLALAGLIEGSYSGIVTPLAPTTLPVPGQDIPAGKINNSGWFAVNLSQDRTINYEFGFTGLPDIKNNYLMLGKPAPSYWSGGAVMKAEEAWNIDTKLDDGRPAFGKVRAGSGVATCTTDYTSASSYDLGTNAINCYLGFILN